MEKTQKYKKLLFLTGISMAFIALLGFSLSGCKSDKDKAKLETTTTNVNLDDTTVDNPPTTSDEEDLGIIEESTPEPETQTEYVDNSGNSGYNDSLFLENQDSLDISADLLAEIRQALLAEDYPKVLSLVENQSDDASTYYKGIAYFVMMQEDKKYEPQERAEYAKLAEQVLGDIANNTQYDGLRARAMLWYAVTLQAQHEDYPNLKLAVATLYKIKNYPNSRVYNDSVYYMGNVHAKMGWYGPARFYYKKVANLNQNGDDRIYDYTDKTFYSPSAASEAGLARLRDYMDGNHTDYKKEELNY